MTDIYLEPDLAAEQTMGGVPMGGMSMMPKTAKGTCSSSSSKPNCYTTCDNKCKEAIKMAKKSLKDGGCPVTITMIKPPCKRSTKAKPAKSSKPRKKRRTTKAKCCKGKPCGLACIPQARTCRTGAAAPAASCGKS